MSMDKYGRNSLCCKENLHSAKIKVKLPAVTVVKAKCGRRVVRGHGAKVKRCSSERSTPKAKTEECMSSMEKRSK